METGKNIRIIVVIISMLFLCFACSPEKPQPGETLFKKHCAECHSNGGNIINPEKTLHKEDLEKNNVRTPADIINKIRNPGPGMRTFDKNILSDEEAVDIALYIIETFD